MHTYTYSIVMGYSVMKRHLHLSFSTLLLFVTLLPGCAYFTRETTAEQIKNEQRYDDASIKTSIASDLLRADASKANDVNVHCFNGHVFLIGEADKDFRNTALEVARKAEGVVHVTTHWFPSGTASSAEDTAIESEIESKLLLTEDISARRLAVDVWGGHVVLTGLADKQSQVDNAVAKIKTIKQVRSVTSYLALN